MNVTRRRKHGFAEAYLRLIRAKLVAGFTCLTLILRFQVFASGCSPVPSNQISWAIDNLDRLRTRGLSTKRSLALREFALGVEALERFVRKEPLRRVHEAVFGVLALESEPVDPRL